MTFVSFVYSNEFLAGKASEQLRNYLSKYSTTHALRSNRVKLSTIYGTLYQVGSSSIREHVHYSLPSILDMSDNPDAIHRVLLE